MNQSKRIVTGMLGYFSIFHPQSPPQMGLSDGLKSLLWGCRPLTEPVAGWMLVIFGMLWSCSFMVVFVIFLIETLSLHAGSGAVFQPELARMEGESGGSQRWDEDGVKDSPELVCMDSTYSFSWACTASYAEALVVVTPVTVCTVRDAARERIGVPSATPVHTKRAR